jgi:hypothetical protein
MEKIPGEEIQKEAEMWIDSVSLSETITTVCGFAIIFTLTFLSGESTLSRDALQRNDYLFANLTEQEFTAVPSQLSGYNRFLSFDIRFLGQVMRVRQFQ